MSQPTHIAEQSWRSSTYSQSNGGECVQVADHIPGAVPVRDSKNPGGPILTFRPYTFATFVQAVQQGEFVAS